MEIVNREKGYLWPFDTICLECYSKIHLKSSSDFTFSDGTYCHYECKKCGHSYRTPKERIPEETLRKIPLI